ncbi:hypothetical protein [Halorhodospira halophila]|uniref:hypothetical protein n=1 Tax=Halorhodospira halophila TaxID=1053 RepID=UPI001913C875|nr:hypothetical protein [Halorhodospira halophila]MBK5942523.1 hypothetical protein [Halorhodospira halophila]
MSRKSPQLFHDGLIERATPPELHDMNRFLAGVRDRSLLDTFRRLASDREPEHQALERQARWALIAVPLLLLGVTLAAWLAPPGVPLLAWGVLALGVLAGGLIFAAWTLGRGQELRRLEAERDELADRAQDLLGVREACLHSRPCRIYRERVVEQGRPLRRREAALLVDYADRQSGGALTASARAQAERVDEHKAERPSDPLEAYGRFREALEQWQERYGTLSEDTSQLVEQLRQQLEVDSHRDTLWYQRLQERKAEKADGEHRLGSGGGDQGPRVARR